MKRAFYLTVFVVGIIFLGGFHADQVANAADISPVHINVVRAEPVNVCHYISPQEYHDEFCESAIANYKLIGEPLGKNLRHSCL